MELLRELSGGSITNLFLGFAFGVFGIYFLKIGRSDANAPWIIIGLALLIFPYFVASAWITFAIGLGLCGVAYRCR